MDDFAEKFEELIECYRKGSRNIEELLKMTRNLGEEQRYHPGREEPPGPSRRAVTTSSSRR